MISSPSLSRPVRLDVAGSATMKLGTFGRTESLAGATGVVGFKEMPEAAFLEAEVFVRDTLDIEALTAAEDVTAVAVLANGQTRTLTDAWLANSPEVDLVGGTTTLRFETGTPGFTSGVA